jgi:hypothetical protein
METRPDIIRVSASHREEIQATDLIAAVETAREKALEQAIRKADTSAHKVAASLGMRLLGVYSLNKNVLEIKSPANPARHSKTIEAQVDIEYRVSGFNQARIDFKIIRDSHNVFRLLKKEFSTRWFLFKLWALSRFSRKQDNRKSMPYNRALVVGHFSIPGGGGTFGDIEAQELVCEWLSQAHIKFDVASNTEDGIKGLKIEQVDERNYGIFIFVCGPWYPQKRIPSLLLKKFKHCLKIGVNLTTYGHGTAGFDYLLSRDSPDEINVDISFANKVNLLPVIGVALVERQIVYAKRQRHLYVKQIIQEYLETGEAVPIWLDTVANNNKVGIKNSQQFESLIRKTDIVITNRLHGMVLGLKNSVPVIAIDAVAGGGKVTAQAKALGWPMLISAESLSVEKLRESVRICLDTNTGPDVKKSQQQALLSIAKTQDQFLNILQKERRNDFK